MATEIERKFLVTSDAWRDGPPGERICQGYLCVEPGRTVRVRTKGNKAYLTIKGAAIGISRAEFEYEIPNDEAEELLKLCIPPLLDKTRCERLHEGFVWEIDEFHGANEGLIVAEIELPGEKTDFAKPDWAGEDVSDDRRYANSSLISHPWPEWGK